MKAVALVVALSLAGAAPSLAEKGLTLRLGSEVRFGGDAGNHLHGLFGLDWQRATRSQEFRLTVSGVTVPLDDDFRLDDGEAEVTYRREAASRRLTVNLKAEQFALGSGGGGDLPDSLAGSEGALVLRNLSSELTFGIGQPLELSAQVNFAAIDYTLADSDLRDRREIGATLGARLTFSETDVLDLSFGSRTIRFTDQATANVSLAEFSALWGHQTASAGFAARAQALQSRDGTAFVLSANRLTETPAGEFKLGLGLGLLSDGSLHPLAELHYTTETRRARIDLALTRRVDISATGEEQIYSRAAMTYELDATQRGTFRIDLAASLMDPLTQEPQSRYFAGLRYDLDLTEDWVLSGGLRHSLWQDQASAEETRNDHLFIAIERRLAYWMMFSTSEDRFAPVPRRRVLAVASVGGHWQQLQLLELESAAFEVLYATTLPDLLPSAGPLKGRAIPDCSRTTPLAALACLAALRRIIRDWRPEVVVSTGALPGVLALGLARIYGARTIWVDSIANAETLSASGKLARRFADLCLSQWPEVAAREHVTYAGAVL